MTTTRPATSDLRTPTRYARSVSRVLTAAFTLSAGYTVYGTVAGLAPDSFNATDPLAWAFYAVGFGLALGARTDRAAAWWTLAGLLPVLLYICVFVYPDTFTPELQTPIGWLENDGYTGLLMIAAYLTWQRLRGHSLAR
jgi:hypothetical protein